MGMVEVFSRGSCHLVWTTRWSLILSIFWAWETTRRLTRALLAKKRKPKEQVRDQVTVASKALERGSWEPRVTLQKIVPEKLKIPTAIQRTKSHRWLLSTALNILSLYQGFYSDFWPRNRFHSPTLQVYKKESSVSYDLQQRTVWCWTHDG